MGNRTLLDRGIASHAASQEGNSGLDDTSALALKRNLFLPRMQIFQCKLCIELGSQGQLSQQMFQQGKVAPLNIQLKEDRDIPPHTSQAELSSRTSDTFFQLGIQCILGCSLSCCRRCRCRAISSIKNNLTWHNWGYTLAAGQKEPGGQSSHISAPLL